MHPLPAALTRSLERRGRGLSVLIVRLGAMGDILRTVPAVRLLRRALPEAAIHWVLDTQWAVVLDGHADIDGLLCWPRGEWRGLARSPLRWPALLRSVATFRRALRRTEPLLVLDFHGNLRSGLTAWISGSPSRLGFDGHQQKEGNRWLATHHVPAGDRRTPRMRRNLELLRALGVPDEPLPSGELPLVPAGSAAAARLRRDTGAAGDFAVIAPGASLAQAYKKPPPPLLGALAVHLRERGIVPLVVWGPGEEQDARRVVEASGGQAVCAPRTDLRALAALTAEARLFIGGDSGPMHLACAVGCPVVATYGPTDPLVNGPWGVPHRAVFPPGRTYTGIKRRDRSRGFEGLEPAHLIGAVDSLLGPR